MGTLAKFCNRAQSYTGHALTGFKGDLLRPLILECTRAHKHMPTNLMYAIFVSCNTLYQDAKPERDPLYYYGDEDGEEAEEDLLEKWQPGVCVCVSPSKLVVS